RQRAGRRADLGREVREGREVVAEDRGLARELAPGELHAVAGVACEADDDAVDLLDLLCHRRRYSASARGWFEHRECPRTGTVPSGGCWPVSARSGRSPDDLDAPGAAALEQFVGMDLVAPAQEVRLGLVVGRAVHGRPRLRLCGLRAALELLEPPLGL